VTILSIHNAKDNSFKLIFGNHDLFVEFLRDFINIDMLNEVKPSDIEDVSERFLPLFEDNKDSDTVKRIQIREEAPLFVIAILEHESKVNFRSSFKMLHYITLVLADYEKQAEEDNPGVSKTKGFMYPPVLPIVFYDGPGEWHAETNFVNKTWFKEAFYQYIPKFNYELINLGKYSREDLLAFGDTLSVVMLIDKVQTKESMALLRGLPSDYLEGLSQKVPEPLLKLIADVIKILLTRINVPKDEIAEITEKLYERRIQDMFAFIEPYDVQETRRLEREAVSKEYKQVLEEKEHVIKQVIEEKEHVIEEKEHVIKQVIEKNNKTINETIKNMLRDGQRPEKISEWFKIPLTVVESAHNEIMH
jgi:hypothetical protein